MTEYFFDRLEEEAEGGERKIFTLIIYDIVDNKVRTKFAKHLQGYGFRVQRSSFEAMLPRKKYEKLLKEIPCFVSEEDSVRVYRLAGQCNLIRYGKDDSVEAEDVIVI